MKTRVYCFRGYKLHIPEQLKVYIGNDETEFLVYLHQKSYQRLAHLSWVEENQSLRVFIPPFVEFEYLVLGEKEFALHCRGRW